MKLACYRTKWGAERYAREIVAKFPSVRTEVRNLGFYDWHVLVTTADGRSAWGGLRPRNYGVDNYAAMLQGNYRIPNSAGL